MSYVVTAPELMASAATDLSNVGSAVTSANSAASAPTTRLLAAGEDEVSAAVASLFSSHGNAFQAVSAKAAEFHSQFVSVLRGGAGAYLHTEAANAQGALSHQLGKITAAAAGPAATDTATLGPGTYGPGVYADGRVFVSPGASVTIDPGSTLKITPTLMLSSPVILMPYSKILLLPNSSLTVGSESKVFVGHQSDVIVASSLTVGPQADLRVGSDLPGYPGGNLRVGTMTINYSRVEIFRNSYIFTPQGPVTISHGIVTGSPQIGGQVIIKSY